MSKREMEIIKTHSSTSPSGTTITLASNLSNNHSIGERVYKIKYDQVELSHASTESGSKSTLSTSTGSGIVALQADEKVLVYDETEHTSGYYFARFKDSISGNFGSYTDAVPYGGFARGTVGYAIDYALKRNKLDGFTNDITHEFCIDELNEGISDMRNSQRSWPELRAVNEIIGQTARGTLTECHI